jgi:hypothetical protein
MVLTSLFGTTVVNPPASWICGMQIYKQARVIQWLRRRLTCGLLKTSFMKETSTLPLLNSGLIHSLVQLPIVFSKSLSFRHNPYQRVSEIASQSCRFQLLDTMLLPLVDFSAEWRLYVVTMVIYCFHRCKTPHVGVLIVVLDIRQNISP